MLIVENVEQMEISDITDFKQLLVPSSKAEHNTFWPSDPTSRFPPGKNVYIGWPKDKPKNIQSIN